MAKTVSLLVTPATSESHHHWPRIYGEISLIPRHPDDDTIVDDWESRSSDILAGYRSDANSREEEQGDPAKRRRSQISRLANRNASDCKRDQPEPPQSKSIRHFKMKIIYPDRSVGSERFDVDTGEPAGRPVDRAEWSRHGFRGRNVPAPRRAASCGRNEPEAEPRRRTRIFPSI